MTEAEWLTSDDLRQMLRHLEPKAFDRKHRLFAVACCSRIRSEMNDRGWAAVTAAEQFADDLIPAKHLRAMWNAVTTRASKGKPAEQSASMAARMASAPHKSSVAFAGVSTFAANAAAHASYPVTPVAQTNIAETAAQAALLRCIFGNPFCPITFDPRWRSETAVALAAGIYDGRHFDRLPILADALEDAGCDNFDLLNHLRGPGPHARGCWAVDAVLGRS